MQNLQKVRLSLGFIMTVKIRHGFSMVQEWKESYLSRHGKNTKLAN